jgi:glucosamine--fructose-6-phosphate aminotransferase (isomerizing)
MSPFNFDLLEGPYLQDLLDQPRAMAETVAALPALPPLDPSRFRRIVLTGMGGSFPILHPLHVRLTQAGFDAVMVETSELLYALPRLIAPESLIIMVSQSGASAETVRLLEHAAPRPFVIGVTNTVGSPLARKADLAVFTRAGEEMAVSCKTAVTAMAALHWIGEHLCGADPAGARRDLDTLGPALRAYLDRWRNHVRDLSTLLDGVEHFFAVGRGRSLAAAGMGGMIQKEAAHVHGEGMSSAAFRHGPFEMLSPDVFVLVFDGDPEVRTLNRGLLKDVIAAGARAALCGVEAEEQPFLLPAAAPGVQPIIELLPPQMVSLALAGVRGHQPGKFERITKVTKTE